MQCPNACLPVPLRIPVCVTQTSKKKINKLTRHSPSDLHEASSDHHCQSGEEEARRGTTRHAGQRGRASTQCLMETESLHFYICKFYVFLFEIHPLKNWPRRSANMILDQSSCAHDRILVQVYEFAFFFYTT